MRKESLSSLCKIINGYAFKSTDYTGTGYRVIRITNVQKGIVVDNDPKFIPEVIADKADSSKLMKNDILISLTGNVGRVGRIDEQLLPAVLNQRVGLIRINTSKLDDKYLFQYLNSDTFENEAINNSNGVAQLNLSSKWVEKHQIPLPPLDDQKRIAHLLGKVEGMIARRKQHLQQLDELLKSVFLEMFGDHFVQESHKSFGEYIDVLTDYHANGSYEILRDHVELQTTPNFALMVRTTDLENNNFDNGCNCITEEAYEFLSKSKVYGGEIIINKIGSAGRVYLMPFLNRPVSLGMNAFLLRFNEDLNNIYAYHLLTSDFGTKAIQKHVKGAVTKTITKNAIRSIKIPVPPITLQNQFAAIVEKVESLKSRYQSSLSNLENLYGVLSQKAFKGELDLSRVPMEVETR